MLATPLLDTHTQQICVCHRSRWIACHRNITFYEYVNKVKCEHTWYGQRQAKWQFLCSHVTLKPWITISMIGSDVEHGKTNGDKPKEIIRYNVQLHGRWTAYFDRSDERKKTLEMKLTDPIWKTKDDNCVHGESGITENSIYPPAHVTSKVIKYDVFLPFAVSLFQFAAGCNRHKPLSNNNHHFPTIC